MKDMGQAECCLPSIQLKPGNTFARMLTQDYGHLEPPPLRPSHTPWALKSFFYLKRQNRLPRLIQRKVFMANSDHQGESVQDPNRTKPAALKLAT
jgi:hypothetical protein